MKFPNILGWLHKVITTASAVFISLFGAQAAHNFAAAALGILKSDLGKIALQVVTELQHASNLTNDQKRTEAVARITLAAAAAGIDASTHLIRLLVELAVSAIKEHFAPLELQPLPIPQVGPPTTA
jgi:hypothetical protein